MNFHHIPVLLKEVLFWLAPSKQGIYVDGTLGGGGHSEALLKTLDPKKGRVIGIDRDMRAIQAASKRLQDYPNFKAVYGNFHDIKPLLSAQGVYGQLQGVLLDLGVSSHQLDTADRGFSYHEEATLDMRMDQNQSLTAREILNTYSQKELTDIFLSYGEEKWAARIAMILVEKRQEKPLETTQDLVRIVDAAIPKAVRRKDEGHPARRVFQGVRIAVNDELAPLNTVLEETVEGLLPGGRLCVITFHSIEDRLVKQKFRQMANPCTCPPKSPICTCGLMPLGKVLGRKGAIKPTDEEIESNIRSRSATLRIFEKQ